MPADAGDNKGGGDAGLLQAVAQLQQLVGLASAQLDLTRATNYLLTEVKTGTLAQQVKQSEANQQAKQPPQATQTGQPRQQESGGARDFDRVLSKYFGKGSDEIDPQKGVGRYLKKAAARSYGRSNTRAYGKQGAKIGAGIARTLGGGPKTRKAAAGVGGAIGKAVGGVSDIAGAVYKAWQAIDGFTDAVFASKARLAEFSGAMSVVLAQREIHQMQRDLERGQKTAATTEKLEAAENYRKTEENKLGIIIDNATNMVMTEINELAGTAIKYLNQGVELLGSLPVLKDIYQALKEKEEQAPRGTFDDILRDANKAAADIEKTHTRMMDNAREAGMGGRYSAPGGFGGPGIP